MQQPFDQTSRFGNTTTMGSTGVEKMQPHAIQPPPKTTLRFRSGRPRPAPLGRWLRRLLPLFLLLTANVATAETSDSFESDQVAWRFENTDCPKARIERHHRIWGEARSGRRAEFVQLRANGGTHAYLTYAIPHSRLIDEFQPRLWVRSNRPGVRFYLRVVLPRAQDPSTGRPLTTLLPGEAIESPEKWTMLSITAVRRLLDRAIPRLRKEFGPGVDGREAYVDKLVLDIYGGPGVTKVWIDDLTYTEIPRPKIVRDAQVRPAQMSDESSGSDAPAVASTRGDVFLLGDRPWFARVIEHQGEPFAWLQELGFDAILLPAPATLQQLREARRLGLRLIAPPPTDAILAEHDVVAAWRLGEQLGERDVEAVRRLAEETRRRDPRKGRPLMLGARTNAWDFRRSGDIFLLERPLLGSVHDLREQGQWWRREPERSRLAGPIWAGIDTQLPTAVVEQVIAHRADQSLPFTYVEPDQLRALAYHAVASGGRGLVFRSTSPLDRDDASTRIRARSLELLLRELRLIEPWAGGGVCEGDAAVPNRDLRASVLRTERSQLLLLTRTGPHQQFAIGAAARNEFGITTDAVSSSAQAYRLTFTTLQPLRSHRAPGGYRIQLSDGEVTSLVILTQNRRVMEYVGRTLLEQGPQIAHLRFEIAEMHWERTRKIIERLNALGNALPRTTERIQQARELLDQSRERLQASDLDWSVSLSNEAMKVVNQLRRSHWEQAAMAFNAPQAAPLCADFSLLPEHWGLSQRVQKGYWGVNLLAAGDFENLDHMLQAGWRRGGAEASETTTRIELSLQSPRSGRRALRLVAARQPSNGLQINQQPRLRVTSAPVPVKQGQLIRIHGWVSVNADDQGQLRIFDGFSGEPFGRRIRKTEGWTEFTLYRAAPRDDYLIVRFELEDAGEVLLDDVTVSVLQIPESIPAPSE